MLLFSTAVAQSLLIQIVYTQGCLDVNGVKFTFYGYPDGNSDTTSFGCSGTSPTGSGNNGGTAGGSGTYSDPETFATAMDNTNFKECEIIYLPYLQKYFRYNDHCEQCNIDYHNGLIHVDLWIGSDTNGGAAQTACEDSFGAVTDQVIIRFPPDILPVDSRALWDGITCYSSPSQGRVFPNLSTNGLCSGGSSSSDGGYPAANLSASKSSPAPQNTSTTLPPPVGSSASRKNPPNKSEVVSQAPPSSVSSAPVVQGQLQSPSAHYSPTSRTFMISVASPGGSLALDGKASEYIPGMTYAQEMAASYAGCAPWNGCLGDPCQTFSDCAGQWVCVAGECTDSMHD